VVDGCPILTFSMSFASLASIPGPPVADRRLDEGESMLISMALITSGEPVTSAELRDKISLDCVLSSLLENGRTVFHREEFALRLVSGT